MFKKVLIATDGSPHSERAVEVGADIASKYDADVCIVHVLLSGEVSEALMRLAEVENLVGYAPRSPSRAVGATEMATVGHQARTAEDEARSYRVLTAVGERILGTSESIAQEHGVRHVATRLADGDPTGEILKAAEEEKADLVVCGTRGLSDFRALMLGSVSHKLSHLSPVTCITVR